MAKNLNELTNEEWWQLFPIILKEHNPDWNKIYQEEKELIKNAIGEDVIERVTHIGSTSVKGLVAKPIIDIMLEVTKDLDTKIFINAMVGAGFIYKKLPDTLPMLFLKGYTPEGVKGQLFHVHVKYLGDWDELYFADYLKKHSDVAKEYEKLKLRLKEEFEHDREGYTDSKTDFIKSVTLKAREEFKGKYNPKYRHE